MPTDLFGEKEMEFAQKLASDFLRRNGGKLLEEDDVRATAWLALCDAARLFDPNYGISFTTYAYVRIRGALLDLLRTQLKLRRLHGTEREETEAAGTAAVRPRRQLTAEQVGTAAVAGNGDHRDPDFVSIDTLMTDEACHRLRVHRALRSLLEDLPTAEQAVIRQHYFEDKTFDKIGEDLGGRSKTWVSTYHMRGIDRLRDKLVERFTPPVRGGRPHGDFKSSVLD